ncbi:phasin family protein [Mastigocoleus sp. MO_188.B34]|uniref:phasin family protein n=1 Tax=Mastigocoleus sp. MO_188.B34 TaxID=3036635 RepID=UPI002619ACD1|nr:phasin family protein [Mastigocoleus sp. MO_188.B34]MDJ0694258.1 phasin family protein [Mastigocoleus sp. MO_188.B34]
MPGFGDIIQKAVYLGVGLAAYAGEKAGSKLSELRSQVQKLADEMVERGEMTTDEARRFVEDMMKQAQNPSSTSNNPQEKTSSQPRQIEILEDGEGESSNSQNSNVGGNQNVDNLRQQVLDLQEELRRLQRDR